MIFMLYIFLYILLHINNKVHISRYFQPFLQQQQKWPLHFKGLLPCCCEHVTWKHVPWWDAPGPSAWGTWTAVELSPSSTEAVLSWLQMQGFAFAPLNFSPELSKFGKLEDPTDNPKEDALDGSVNTEGQADFREQFGEICSLAPLPTWRRCCSSSLLEVTLLPASLADCSMNDTTGNTCWSQQREAQKPGPCSAS